MKVRSFSQGAYEKVKTQVSLDPKLELITTHSSIPHAGPASWAWDLPCAEGTQALLVLCCRHLHILSNSDQRAPFSFALGPADSGAGPACLLCREDVFLAKKSKLRCREGDVTGARSCSKLVAELKQVSLLSTCPAEFSGSTPVSNYALEGEVL